MNIPKAPEDVHTNAAISKSKGKITFKDYFDFIGALIMSCASIGLFITSVQAGYIPWDAEIVSLIMLASLVVLMLVAMVRIITKTFKKDNRE